MFNRVVRGAVTVVAAAGLLAAGGGVSAFATSRHSATTLACTMSPTTVGGSLTVSGSGYTPGGKYAVAMTWPYGGTGDLLTTADDSGNLSVSTWAYWSGTYSANVLDSHGNTVASCSETVT